MSCCGETTTAPLNKRHRMRVRYLGGMPLVLKGPVTGATHRFSGTERDRLVDPRDAVMIARDRRFRIDGIVELTESTESEPQTEE